MSAAELAWAAGFIDGEGSIGVNRQRDRRKGPDYFTLRPALQVSNTDRGALERLREILGCGSVIETAVRNPRHARHFHYSLRGRSLLEPLERLAPYLYLKVEQAVLVQQFIRNRIIANAFGRGRYAPYDDGSLWIWRRLAELNKKGPRA